MRSVLVAVMLLGCQETEMPGQDAAVSPAIAPDATQLQCPTVGGCCDFLPDEMAMSVCFVNMGKTHLQSGQCGTGSCRRADCTIVTMTDPSTGLNHYCKP